MEKSKQRKIYQSLPPEDVSQQLAEGKKFIPVGEDFPESAVPEKYMLARVRYRDSTFSALVPKETFFYMANPGEGDDLDGALDDISQLYGDVKQFEKAMIANGDTNVQEADWATMTRDSYSTYLINKLTHDGKSFTADIEKKFDGPEVQKRMRAIAALALSKQIDEIKKQDISEVLLHRTPIVTSEEVTEKYREKHMIRCHAGSHYEMREKYRTQTRRVVRQSVSEEASIGAKISELEDEILKNMGTGAGNSHDRALVRQYINIAYIAKENPDAQLDISPAVNARALGKERKISKNQDLRIDVVDIKKGPTVGMVKIEPWKIEQVGTKLCTDDDAYDILGKFPEYNGASFYRVENENSSRFITFFKEKK